MPFGQIIVGPPGSGKTTYTHAVSQFLDAINRPYIIVNLDPANENIPYKCDIDVNDLITLEDVMNEFGLGPNGSLIYCMEFLEKNMDWLLDQLEAADFRNKYVVIDCPGQVELYTTNNSVLNIISNLTSTHSRSLRPDEESASTATVKPGPDLRLTVLNLIDSSHLMSPTKYISILLLSLQTMLHLALPHINVLTKMDLVESYGKLSMSLEFYLDVMDLSYLLDQLNQDAFSRKYYKLNEALVSLLEDFAYVNFHPLCVLDKESMWRLIKAVDKSNGYIYQPDEKKAGMFEEAAALESEWEWRSGINERYLKDNMKLDEYVADESEASAETTLERERAAIGLQGLGKAAEDFRVIERRTW